MLRLLCISALLSSAAHANGLRIWPIDPHLGAQQFGTTLWTENRTDQDIVLQVRVLRWSQHNGEDRYDEQSDVQASPPIANIAPGAQQLIRLIDTKRAPRSSQQAYRIFIDEVPAVRPQQTSSTSTNIQFRMRYVLPLFASAPQDPPKEKWGESVALRCTLSADGLRVQNTGTLHARLSDVRFGADAGGRVTEGLLGYVLPGQTMRFNLPANTQATAPLIADVNGRAGVTIGACTS